MDTEKPSKIGSHVEAMGAMAEAMDNHNRKNGIEPTPHSAQASWETPVELVVPTEPSAEDFLELENRLSVWNEKYPYDDRLALGLDAAKKCLAGEIKLREFRNFEERVENARLSAERDFGISPEVINVAIAIDNICRTVRAIVAQRPTVF